MKQKLGFIIGGFLAIVILGVGIIYSNTTQAEASLSTNEIMDMVSKQYPGEITEIEQETEFNRKVYEVEIKTDDKEYEIKLDGKTGEILNVSEKSIKDRVREKKEVKDNVAQSENDQSKNEAKVEEKKPEQAEKVEQTAPPKEIVIKEKEEQSGKQNKNEQAPKEKVKEKAPEKKAKEQAPTQKAKEESPKQKKKEQKKTVISYEEAKRIALGAFSGEIDDIELDREDGRLIYEVEIERGDKEAEIEIDAYTGEIILIEIDED